MIQAFFAIVAAFIKPLNDARMRNNQIITGPLLLRIHGLETLSDWQLHGV